jgi:urease alpha subunit
LSETPSVGRSRYPDLFGPSAGDLIRLGEAVEAAPATELPMAQRYFLF